MSRFFSFNETVLAGIKWVGSATPEDVAMLLRVGLDLIRDGPDAASLRQAAEHLGVAESKLQSRVQPLCQLLIDVARGDPSEPKLRRALAELEFPAATESALVEYALAHKRQVLDALSTLALELPEYRDLQWRLDVEVGRRMRTKETRPLVVMRLDTVAATGGVESTWMEADLTNLHHVLDELKAAVGEAKGVHSQRMQRYIR